LRTVLPIFANGWREKNTEGGMNVTVTRWTVVFLVLIKEGSRISDAVFHGTVSRN